MFAIPTVVLRDGQPQLLDGLLVKLPAELQTPNQLAWYAFHAKAGWSVCPQGFYVYVKTNEQGEKFIFPGLLIEGEPRSKKWRAYKQPLFMTKAQVVDFVTSSFGSDERTKKERDQEIGALIHDLRALSGNIYHNAEDAKVACEQVGYPYAINRIENVLASQGMLSLRIDLLGFTSGNAADDSTVEMVSVYKKVDKVVRCFRPNARDRGMGISLQGKSLAQTRGPNNFELIPYALIDNAMKYAPNNSTIVASIEDGEKDITVSVNSLGPFLEASEYSRIFESGYRGIHAINSKQAGTGIGLYTAKKFLQQFNGNIWVEQDSAVHEMKLIPYFMTKFTLRVPKAG